MRLNKLLPSLTMVPVAPSSTWRAWTLGNCKQLLHIKLVSISQVHESFSKRVWAQKCSLTEYRQVSTQVNCPSSDFCWAEFVLTQGCSDKRTICSLGWVADRSRCLCRLLIPNLPVLHMLPRGSQIEGCRCAKPSLRQLIARPEFRMSRNTKNDVKFRLNCQVLRKVHVLQCRSLAPYSTPGQENVTFLFLMLELDGEVQSLLRGGNEICWCDQHV